MSRRLMKPLNMSQRNGKSREAMYLNSEVENKVGKLLYLFKNRKTRKKRTTIQLKNYYATTNYLN